MTAAIGRPWRALAVLAAAVLIPVLPTVGCGDIPRTWESTAQVGAP